MEILVVILSGFLAVFLILGIIFLTMLIKLSQSLKRIAVKAEGLVDNVESAAATLKNAAGPIAVGKFLVNIADTVLSKKKGKG